MARVTLLVILAFVAVVDGLVLPHVARPMVIPRSSVSCMAKPTDLEGNPIKAAMSSYMHFCAERRAGLTTELKASMGAEYKNTAVMSTLGAEWKTLSEGEKARFVTLATADKQRFDAAVASNPANKQGKAKKERTGPKKLSAYMHFCGERRVSLTAELKVSMGADYKNTAVMSALGAEWKKLGESDKARFEAMALVPVE